MRAHQAWGWAPTAKKKMLATILAAAALGTLEADLKEVAALRGEPSIVSAAGVTRDDRPILTLENPSAFDPTSTKLRAVLYAAGGNERTATAVLDMVRWLKTSAPQALRDQWVVSALPSVDLDPAAKPSFDRWIRFQAPDVAIEIVDADTRPIGLGVDDVPPWVIGLPAAPDALGSTLRSAAARDGRSPLHDVLARRATRAPVDVARLLAARYPGMPSISYIPALSWVAALKLARTTGDQSLEDKVRRQVQPWLSGDRPLFGDRVQLTSVAGTMVFADLAAGGDAAALKLATEGATLAAARRPDGIAEYGPGWTDDMFMAASVLARASRLEGHADDLNHAARLLIDYAARLQRPDGLFNHASDAPAAWGRGNGFAAFGLMEALSVMAPSHPLRPQLLDIFRRHMSAVRAQQAPDGMWREVLDEPGAYREETATAMLLTALARGVRLGWLDRSYAPSIARAWRALAAHVDADGGVMEVCASTGAGPTKRYYLDRPALTGGDDRGGAMALIAALELTADSASLLR